MTMEPSDHDRLVRMESQLEDIRHALLGNGRPGLFDDFVETKSKHQAELTQIAADVAAVRAAVPTKKEKFGGYAAALTVVASIVAKLLGVPTPL